MIDTPAGPPERIELGGGWHFAPVRGFPGSWEFVSPWGTSAFNEEHARAFAAALRQVPAFDNPEPVEGSGGIEDLVQSFESAVIEGVRAPYVNNLGAFELLDQARRIARSAILAAFTQRGATIAAQQAEIDHLAKAVQEWRLRAHDAISTLDAWFNTQKLVAEQTDQPIRDAASAYLRTARNGGMPREISDRAEAVVDDMVRLGMFSAVISRVVASTEAELDRLRSLTAAQGVPSQAAIDVIVERRRQVEAEGWTAQHDDQHDEGELAKAASCYAAASVPGCMDLMRARALALWPWETWWWKPSDRRQNLIKAGALILAEIERLDRAQIARQSAPQPREEEQL